MTAARGPPVTLRDFLELGCDSSSDGFRSYPRCLPSNGEIDLLRRSPSRSPSSLFSLAARSPSSGALAARISSLSRSFSRRIRDGFWRRRDDDDGLHFVDDRDSCGFPSPLVSSCSASDSETEYDDEADLAIIHDKVAACPSASECDKPSSSSSSSAGHDRTDGAAAADGKTKMQADGDPAVGRSKLGMEDKQQLSPVSVLDFPFDDDDADERSDAGTCSPSFHRCPPPPDDLHTRTTTKQAQQLLHTIQRYDAGIAQAVDPVDLEARFTTSSDSGESADASTHLATTTSSFTDATTSSSSATRHGEEHQSVDQQPSLREQQEPEEYRLLARLLHQEEDTAAAAADEVSQVLLLDFFAEGIDQRLRSSALVRAAAEWVRGAGLGWGIRDMMLSGKQAALEDMERGRRWMCVAEEQRDVGAAVEGLVMDQLVDDLVAELVPCTSWHGDGRRWGY